VYSQQVWHTAKIDTVYTLANGAVVLLFDVDSHVCTNLSTPKKYYYITIGVNGVTASGFKNIYTAALVAASTNKEVLISFDSGTNSCDINRLSVRF
jgi:hypothetical protein